MAEKNEKTHAFSSPHSETRIRGVNKGNFKSHLSFTCQRLSYQIVLKKELKKWERSTRNTRVRSTWKLKIL